MSTEPIQKFQTLTKKLDQKKNEVLKLEQEKKNLIFDDTIFEYGFWYSLKPEIAQKEHSAKGNGFSIFRLDHDHYIFCPNHAFGGYIPEDYRIDLIDDSFLNTERFLSDFVKSGSLIEWHEELTKNVITPLEKENRAMEYQIQEFNLKIAHNKENIASLKKVLGDSE